MRLDTLIEGGVKTEDETITDRVKIDEDSFSDEVSSGDKLDVEHDAITAFVFGYDEYTESMSVLVNVDLQEI